MTRQKPGREPSGERGADAGTVLQSASTDTNGYFEMEDPPPGNHLLLADARDVRDGSGTQLQGCP